MEMGNDGAYEGKGNGDVFWETGVSGNDDVCEESGTAPEDAP